MNWSSVLPQFFCCCSCLQFLNSAFCESISTIEPQCAQTYCCFAMSKCCSPPQFLQRMTKGLLTFASMMIYIGAKIVFFAYPSNSNLTISQNIPIPIFKKSSGKSNNGSCKAGCSKPKLRLFVLFPLFGYNPEILAECH